MSRYSNTLIAHVENREIQDFLFYLAKKKLDGKYTRLDLMNSYRECRFFRFSYIQKEVGFADDANEYNGLPVHKLIKYDDVVAFFDVLEKHEKVPQPNRLVLKGQTFTQRPDGSLTVGCTTFTDAELTQIRKFARDGKKLGKVKV